MRYYQILDLDNTIADDGWRVKAIQWQHEDPTRRYADYHLLAAFDHVGNTDLLTKPLANLILTARPVAYRAITLEWLRRKGIIADHVLMRNNGDHRSSAQIKQEQLQHLALFYDITPGQILHAYDDRQDVVDMFRRNGILSSRRPIHGEDAFTNKRSKEHATEERG